MVIYNLERISSEREKAEVSGRHIVARKKMEIKQATASREFG